MKTQGHGGHQGYSTQHRASITGLEQGSDSVGHVWGQRLGEWSGSDRIVSGNMVGRAGLEKQELWTHQDSTEIYSALPRLQAGRGNKGKWQVRPVAATSHTVNTQMQHATTLKLQF